MTCCADPGCDAFFNARVAARDARAYRRRGLRGTAAAIVRHLVASGIDGASVLEVGGGVGAMQLELLKAGAARATIVELSPAYEPYARELAREAGLEGRIRLEAGDFAVEAQRVERADVVVLNRVVCCYPDYELLVGSAAEHARRHLVLTFPRDSWWTRAVVGSIALVQRLRRQSFRPFVHPPRAIVAAAEARGLTLVRDRVGPVWQLVALERPVTSAAVPS